MLSLFAAALAFQATPLPADDAMAARKCAAAVPQLYQSDRLQGSVLIEYFLFQAADAEGTSGAAFLPRTVEMLNDLDRGSVTADDAERVLGACVERWPGAFSEAPVVLPDSAFDRDFLCLGSFILLSASAKALRNNGLLPPETPEYQTYLTRYAELLTPNRMETFGDGKGPVELAGEQLKASIDIGRLDQIAGACIARLED
ncbi:hypothetical protein [Stakelama tenebrarum]|uniref:Uncharacterized protein n=1 Tax=Stakelama tenebrarum TaxID=2711215 RepID=A0A6G6Y4Z8_9SPHN|nr:hypothetical protein [Sphingosinithalassobacter tenebrarum]QIG79921.1 hypothetical protein G5C33_09110 [Sphingosinithalassobacter tenebrarum]